VAVTFFVVLLGFEFTLRPWGVFLTYEWDGVWTMTSK
jgi:hypothetical protein